MRTCNRLREPVHLIYSAQLEMISCGEIRYIQYASLAHALIFKPIVNDKGKLQKILLEL